MIKTVLTTCGVLAVTAGLCFSGVQVGQNAPDFSLKDTNGKTQQLSSYKGKYVVLEWYQPDCPFVRKHYGSGNMQKLQKEYTAKGIVWLSIDSSAPGQEGNYDAAKLNAFAARDGAARTALMIDSDGKVGHLYGAKTTPDMYIIDPSGKLIYAGAIDDHPTPEISDIQLSKNYVSTALSEAMSGKAVQTPVTRPYGCSVKYWQ